MGRNACVLRSTLYYVFFVDGGVMSIETLRDKAIRIHSEVAEGEQVAVTRDFICELVKLFERSVNMPPTLATAYTLKLAATWREYCDRTETDNGDGTVDKYDYGLFGSAMVCLNPTTGRKFVNHFKIPWSRDGVEVFSEWVEHVVDDLTL